MTPVDNVPEDTPEGRYNTIQKKARSTIERTFGILKGRWRCLLAARELHYAPSTAGFYQGLYYNSILSSVNCWSTLLIISEIKMMSSIILNNFSVGIIFYFR